MLLRKNRAILGEGLLQSRNVKDRLKYKIGMLWNQTKTEFCLLALRDRMPGIALIDAVDKK